jgi:hypothetical protein
MGQINKQTHAFVQRSEKNYGFESFSPRKNMWILHVILCYPMTLTCNEIHQITKQSTHHTKDVNTRMKQRCDQHVLKSRIMTYSLNSSIVWGLRMDKFHPIKIIETKHVKTWPTSSYQLRRYSIQNAKSLPLTPKHQNHHALILSYASSFTTSWYPTL